MTLLSRMEAAYWLTLAFRLEGERRRERNGLVLTASRRCGLGLLDLVQLDVSALPEPLARFRPTLERLQASDGEVSGMAFLVDELAERGVELLPITHPAYPPHLARTLKPEAAPTLLSAAGDVRLLTQPGVCVSGSRKAGPTGVAFARACGEALAAAGITVVTGLAAGPDREALSGSLDHGGRAIGVAPEGILMSRATRDPMVREGRLCVISEFHPKQKWQAGLAMARNRTLAGMSRALFVADCESEGGTTNQVEVHRSAGLPVLVRRGEGEGAFVSTLATQPGVLAFLWEGGPVDLPSTLLDGASAVDARPTAPPPSTPADPAEALRREIAQRRQELADLERCAAQCRADLADLEERLGAAAVKEVRSTPSRDTPFVMVREPAPLEYSAAPVTPATPDVPPVEGPIEDRLLALVRSVTEPISIPDIASALGVSEPRARAAAKAEVTAGRIEAVRVGRSVKYARTTALGLFGHGRHD